MGEMTMRNVKGVARTAVTNDHHLCSSPQFSLCCCHQHKLRKKKTLILPSPVRVVSTFSSLSKPDNKYPKILDYSFKIMFQLLYIAY